MTTTAAAGGLDLDKVLSAGWVDRDDLDQGEYARAEAFYDALRAHDTRLLGVRKQAFELVREWTGRDGIDVGSFGTRVNLETSDLDVGIGVAVADRPALRAALEGKAEFIAERRTSAETSRLVFGFALEDVHVDLSALEPANFARAKAMLEAIEAGMSTTERVCHTWVKHHLREAGRMDDYAAWKLVVYGRFNPDFDWVPIPEKPAS